MSRCGSAVGSWRWGRCFGACAGDSLWPYLQAEGTAVLCSLWNVSISVALAPSRGGDAGGLNRGLAEAVVVSTWQVGRDCGRPLIQTED